MIGLPGEQLELRRKKIYINGQPLAEPYIRFPADYTFPEGNEPLVVPEASYFVLGRKTDSYTYTSDGSGSPVVTRPFFAQNVNPATEEVIAQVLTPFAVSALKATAVTDVNSIMCYDLPGSIMKDGIAVPGGKDIDNLDAAFAATLYPGPV